MQKSFFLILFICVISKNNFFKYLRMLIKYEDIFPHTVLAVMCECLVIYEDIFPHISSNLRMLSPI
jgi:hypothetical protein